MTSFQVCPKNLIILQTVLDRGKSVVDLFLSGLTCFLLVFFPSSDRPHFTVLSISSVPIYFVFVPLLRSIVHWFWTFRIIFSFGLLNIAHSSLVDFQPVIFLRCLPIRRRTLEFMLSPSHFQVRPIRLGFCSSSS